MTKEGHKRKEEIKETLPKEITQKQQNDNSKSLHINNLPKCKQMELINQEAQTGWVFKKENYMLLTGDIFQL